VKVLIILSLILLVVFVTTLIVVPGAKERYIASKEIDGRPPGVIDPMVHYVSREESRCRQEYQTWVIIQIVSGILMFTSAIYTALLWHHKRQLQQ